MLGFGAVLLWAFLALLTVRSAPVPPFQLNAMAFSVGALPGLLWAWRSGGFGQLRRVNWKVYVFGTAGLFGYHSLYFAALRLAPAAEAGLIAYLWPLLIVLFSGLLPGTRLTIGTIIGAGLGFLGAGLVIGAGASGFSGAYLPGYLLALACAFTWAGYSVVSRRLGRVPTVAVTMFCLATAALSLPLHLMFEKTTWPVGLAGWGSVAALGLGPVGLAFYLWDIGMKRGNIQLLGVFAYAAPLLSTLILIVSGLASPSPALLLAAVLIAAGAYLAAKSTRASVSAC